MNKSQIGRVRPAKRRQLAGLLLLLLLANPGWAAKFALLVGIGDFAPAPPGAPFQVPHLDGPKHDAVALQQVLRNDPAFRGNITLLVNSQATKAAILGRLRDIVGRLAPGDYLFLYVSTHGTSRFAPEAPFPRELIGPETGALIPYDVQYGNPRAVLESLIVGVRDIRPILSQVPRDASVFAVFDSCFSGDTARRITKTTRSFPARYAPMPLSGEELSMLSETPSQLSEWPYSNVMYLSAASKSEKAIDIPQQIIDSKVFRTVDGSPHGALTNFLLLGLKGNADLNRDGMITHRELSDYCRREVEQNFPHKPQFQSPSRELEQTRVFSGSVAGSDAAPLRKAEKTRIRMGDGLPNELGTRIEKLDSIEISHSGPYDLLVRKDEQSGAYELVHPSLDVIHTYGPENTRELLERIRYYRVAKQLLETRFPDQRFNVRLEVLLDGKQGHGEFRAGQLARIQANLDRTVDYAVLLNIDPAGNVTVLYKGRLESGIDRPIGGDNRVVAPFGVEFVKFLAFSEKPAFWDELESARAYDPSSPQLRMVLDSITAPGSGRSETVVKIVTFAQ